MKIFIIITSVVVMVAGRNRRFLFGTSIPFHAPSGFGGSGSGGSGDGGGSYHPCTPQQAYCSLTCDNGYNKGPMGCDYCMCSAQSHSATTLAPVNPVLMTTAGPSTATVVKPTLAPPTVPPPTTTNPPPTPTTVDACITAGMLCAARCDPVGYLVDPSDCTFCVCKNQIGH